MTAAVQDLKNTINRIKQGMGGSHTLLNYYVLFLNKDLLKLLMILPLI